jgi:hypothetical protein
MRAWIIREKKISWRKIRKFFWSTLPVTKYGRFSRTSFTLCQRTGHSSRYRYHFYFYFLSDVLFCYERRVTGAYPPRNHVRQLARLARRVDCLFVCRFSRPYLIDNLKFSGKTKTTVQLYDTVRRPTMRSIVPKQETSPYENVYRRQNDEQNQNQSPPEHESREESVRRPGSQDIFRDEDLVEEVEDEEEEDEYEYAMSLSELLYSTSSFYAIIVPGSYRGFGLCPSSKLCALTPFVLCSDNYNGAGRSRRRLHQHRRNS